MGAQSPVWATCLFSQGFKWVLHPELSTVLLALLRRCWMRHVDAAVTVLELGAVLVPKPPQQHQCRGQFGVAPWGTDSSFGCRAACQWQEQCPGHRPAVTRRDSARCCPAWLHPEQLLGGRREGICWAQPGLCLCCGILSSAVTCRSAAGVRLCASWDFDALWLSCAASPLGL